MGLDDLLFGKSRSGSIPSLNVAPLKERLQTGVRRRMDITGETARQLRPLTEGFRTGTLKRGEQFVGDIGRKGQQFMAGQVNPALRAAFQDRLAREAYAQVPALQQQIRQQLGGAGLTANAAARARLADPLLAAAGDVGRGQLEYDLAQEDARRQALRDVFGAETGALQTQFGTDIGAEEKALGLGREDILRKQGDISGLISEEAAGLNELDLLQQQADIARAQAAAEEAARRSGARREFYGGIGSALLSQFAPKIGQAVSGGVQALKGAFSPTAQTSTLGKVPIRRFSQEEMLKMGIL